MLVRRSTAGDIDEIMRVYDAARNYMRSHGNQNQWIGGYPSRELICEDIAEGISFTVCDGETICGVFAFILGDDPTYAVIDGKWTNDNPYGTIHRIGSDGTRKGILDAALAFAKSRTETVRIDTHADNKTMQNALQSRGFRYCGIITIADGSPRLAYQFN